MGSRRTFGEGLIEGLREAVAWKKGKLALPAVNIDPFPTASREAEPKENGVRPKTHAVMR